MKLVLPLLLLLLLPLTRSFAQDPDPQPLPNNTGISSVLPLLSGSNLSGSDLPPGSDGTVSPITYHYGALILGGTHVYFIWYGDWTNNTATTILPALAGSIGSTPYFNINTTYYDLHHNYVTNSVSYRGSVNDHYSHGSSLSDSSIADIVAQHIGHDLPTDPNGLYFVMASADVHETSGFCTAYCGWHSTGWLRNARFHFGFIGNPEQCPSACESQHTSSPNGNPGADGMASVFAHELDEATNDADLSAWYDAYGNESADKCAWKFGTTLRAANGSNYNITLGGKQYLIQENWVNAPTGYCAMSY